ncbi:MAG: RNA polymerase subunit sigma-70, partial [Acidobacteriota bacterium]|nr:RNA polymerase subunit sigma-70 [Acidobacteriota bacterium]
MEATRATDEELVAAILEGDAALYTDLVERYRGRLINYLNRFLGNAEESEELSQEVFLRVYRALDRYN